MDSPIEIVKNWPPADPIQKMDFTAIVHHVDHHCRLYVQDSELGERALEMSETIQQHMHNTRLDMLKNYWLVGEPCIARWSHDGDFYRANIESICRTGYKVSIYFIIEIIIAY